VTLTVAHRGDPAKCRENTLAGLDSAADCGADWVEVDVKLTADGEPVLLHDFTLKRLWGLDRHVGSVSLAELTNATSGPDWQIPPLGAALAWARDRRLPLMVDIPGRPEGRATVEQVKAMDCLDWVVFAGDPAAMVDVRALAPQARIAMSWEIPQLPGPELLAEARPDYFNQLHTLLDARVVEQVHGLGMQVCAYTVDVTSRMSDLRDMGVDAIISNDIRALVRTVGTLANTGVAHVD
jgi:glycerophosphoryl diester phosphodiesterase